MSESALAGSTVGITRNDSTGAIWSGNPQEKLSMNDIVENVRQVREYLIKLHGGIDADISRHLPRPRIVARAARSKSRRRKEPARRVRKINKRLAGEDSVSTGQ